MPRFVALGEIMIRLTTPNRQRFQQALPGRLHTNFGGAEASVAALLARLGNRAELVTALPDSPLGLACAGELRRMNVDLSHTVFRDEGRIGLYFVEQGIDHRAGQVIYDRGDSSFAVTPPDAYDWDAIFDDVDVLVISGITPALSANAARLVDTAISQARQAGVSIACDMNYRSKLWRWDASKSPQQLASETMQRIVHQVHVLICGSSDATRTLGIDDGIEGEELTHRLADRYPQLQVIASPRRSSVTASHQQFSACFYDAVNDDCAHSPADVSDLPSPVDRIGTGDAFFAALLHALHQDDLATGKQKITYAAAACCLAHTIEGDFSLITDDEIRASAFHSKSSLRLAR